jgi:glycine dehydrogenase subunit 1
MPFIPHTEADTRAMLEAIGARSIDDLFEEIPVELRAQGLSGIPDALNEMEIGRLMAERAAQDAHALSFIGAGAYEHHIPSAVWAIITRGEFYSAYTPYQAEASQGTLQMIYEYQTMIASLTGLEVSNASLYDGASALAEAALMAVRANRKSKSARILVPRTVNPTYTRVARAIAGNQKLVFEDLPYCTAGGHTIVESLKRYEGEDITALVIQQPNFFGTLEDVDELTDWAHRQNALVIAVVNPVSLGILKAPGRWGAAGVDIACGEGQPLGVPLSSGGPYFGFMTTSNICTNQGLLMMAGTVYLALIGPAGLAHVASACVTRTHALVDALCSIKGVRAVFDRPRFHEVVLQLDRPAAAVLDELAARDILGGYDLSEHFPELGSALLVCATETKTQGDIDAYARALADAMKSARAA